MDLLDARAWYYLQLTQPATNSDHLSPESPDVPESPHVLFQLKIFLQIEERILEYLQDGSISELNNFLSTVEERSCTFVLPDDDPTGTRTTLSETLSTLEIGQQYFDQIIGKIVSYGSHMYNHEKNRGLKILPMNVHIHKFQDVYVEYDRSLIDTALRDSAAEFERTNYGMVPARESALRRLLKRVKIEGENHPRKRRRASESQQSCTICIEEFTVGSDAVSMPCSHLFHGECIFRWLKQSHYCPLCRYEMPT